MKSLLKSMSLPCKKDLSFLKPQNGKTGQENLIELGVFDVESQSLNTARLIDVLKFMRENHNLSDEVVYEKLKNS